MAEELTNVNVTKELMKKGSAPQRAYHHLLAAPSERRFDALVRVVLDAMGFAGGVGYIRTISADDYAQGYQVVEEVVAKLKRRTIQPGPAKPSPRPESRSGRVDVRPG
jgi:hypothetical protein